MEELNIKEGENEFLLSDFINSDQYASRVELKMELDDYELEIKKLGYFPSGAVINGKTQNVYKNSRISPYFFTRYRDGCTHIKIISNCSGTIKVSLDKYKVHVDKRTPEQIEEDRIRKKEIRNFYVEKYLNPINGVFHINPHSFDNMIYKSSLDKNLLDYMTRQRNEGEIAKVKVEPGGVIIPKVATILEGVEIFSEDYNHCTLVANNKECLKFRLEKGEHFYNLMLPISGSMYSVLRLHFTEHLNTTVKFIFKELDYELDDALKKNRVVVIDTGASDKKLLMQQGIIGPFNN